jgi:hypothetical protein
MELPDLIALMAASLYDRDCVESDYWKRRTAILDARRLLQDVHDTKLYNPIESS